MNGIVTLRDKILAVIDDVNGIVAEREELVELISIALLTRKNLFILGEPGQAKSYVINLFRQRITAPGSSSACFQNRVMKTRYSAVSTSKASSRGAWLRIFSVGTRCTGKCRGNWIRLLKITGQMAAIRASPDKLDASRHKWQTTARPCPSCTPASPRF
jgi:hypothetical protein